MKLPKLSRSNWLLVASIIAIILLIAFCPITKALVIIGMIAFGPEQPSPEEYLTNEMTRVIEAASGPVSASAPPDLQESSPWIGEYENWTLVQNMVKEHGPEYEIKIIVQPNPVKSWDEYVVEVSFPDEARFCCWTYPAELLEGCHKCFFEYD